MNGALLNSNRTETMPYSFSSLLSDFEFEAVKLKHLFNLSYDDAIFSVAFELTVGENEKALFIYSEMTAEQKKETIEKFCYGNADTHKTRVAFEFVLNYLMRTFQLV